MAPGRKRGAKGVKTKSELSLGDLVLAKVKGFPAWPAKISRPEDWERSPDPKKYFVQFFGTSEIAFVAPADIQAFTSESKNKLMARCQGKTVRYFAQAVKEICEEFEVSQLKNLSGVRDDNNAQNLASETHPIDPVVDEALEDSRKDGIDNEGPNCKLETKGVNEDSGLEHCSGRQDEMECQDVKPCSSNDVMHSLSPHLSSGKRNKLSTDPTNQVKNSVLKSSPSKHVFVKEEGSGGVKVKGRDSDGAQSEMGNGHKSKLTMGPKRKHGDAMHRDNGPIMSPKHIGDGVQSKHVPDRNMKLSSADNSKSGLHITSERKGKNLLKEKKHSEAVDDDRVGEVMCEENNEVVSRKKMKVQHDHQKQTSRKDEASCPKISKGANVVNDASMLRVQSIRKHDSRSSADLDDKMDKIESKSSTSGGKAENHRLLKAQTSTKESRDSNDEDDLPSMKRHGRPLSVMSTSALISENRLGTASRKPGMVHPNKMRSPIKQLPTKRRAVRLCDDDDDELPKTPIHGGSTQKVPVIPRISDSKKKNAVRGESFAYDHPVLRNSGIVDGVLKGQVQSSRVSNKASSSPIAEQGMVKGTRESSAEHLPSITTKLDSEKIPVMNDKPVTVSPKRSPISISATKSSTEPQKKQLSEAPSSISQKKVRPGPNRGLDIASDRSTSSLNHSITESSKPISTEKWRKTPKSDSQINDSVLSDGNPDESTTSLSQRLDVAKDTKTSIAVDLKVSDSAMSMRHLIAAAQARKRQAHLQKSYGITLPLLVPDADVLGRSPGSTPATLAVESSNTLQLDVERLHPTSPFSDVRQFSSISEHENDEHEERRVSSGRQATGSSLSGGTEAAVARDAFEGMIETLSRTKESIGRATRLAIDCAKYGIANEVVELLIQKLESEPSFHRKVDLFFLVDSITQCSHSQKGIAGASYIPTVQAALPRLIGAAAPPGMVAQENRRQCHKVLRLWLERKIFPDHVLRRHMDDIGTVNIDTSAGFSQRRPSRAERAIDDPIREMEGMLVDEYGSNATFQLPGLLSSRLFEEEEEEDEDNFPINLYKEVADTSPSEHTPASRDPETYTVTPSDRRHCILEEVDGELEMEDVSGHQKDERPLFGNDTSAVEPNSDVLFESASNISELLSSPEGSPPLPPGSPPVTPPLPDSPPPSSPPPPPPPLSSPSPPPPPPPPPSSQHIFPPPPFGPPPFLSQQSLPPQPALMSQNMPPLPSTVPTSQPLAHHPPSLPHEIGGPHTVNQHVHMVSNAHGPRMDAPVRGEVFSQQSSFFSPAPVSNAREHVAYNSTRPIEYGQGDSTYMNPQPSQQRQQFMSGSTPFAQRPLHPEPPQGIPSHFSYPNQVQQHEYPPYPVPNVSDGPRRYATDEQWRKQVNEFNADSSRGGWMTGGKSYPGPPYSHEVEELDCGVITPSEKFDAQKIMAGYFGPPPERPATNGIGFQPSAANSLPAAPVSVHGIPMMPGRSDMSTVNWRPT